MTVAPPIHETNIRHETPNKNRRDHDSQSRKSALKSTSNQNLTGQSNTRAASYGHNKGGVTDHGGAIYVEERDMSKVTPGESDFRDEQVRRNNGSKHSKHQIEKPHGSTFDGKTLPSALIDFAAVSHAPIRGDRSEMRASVKLAPL